MLFKRQPVDSYYSNVLLVTSVLFYFVGVFQCLFFRMCIKHHNCFVYGRSPERN